MNILFCRLALGITLGLFALHPCHVNAQNQQEMNHQAAKAFEQADNLLNKVYKQLMAKLDEQSQAKLKAVQRAWVLFRDAQAEFHADLEARGGSMAPLIFNGTRATLTKARIKELEQALKDYAN